MMQDSFAFLYLCTKQRIVVFHNMRPLKQLKKKKNLENVIIVSLITKLSYPNIMNGNAEASSLFPINGCDIYLL